MLATLLKICDNCSFEPVLVRCTTANLVVFQECDWDVHSSCFMSASHNLTLAKELSGCIVHLISHQYCNLHHLICPQQPPQGSLILGDSCISLPKHAKWQQTQHNVKKFSPWNLQMKLSDQSALTQNHPKFTSNSKQSLRYPSLLDNLEKGDSGTLLFDITKHEC